MSYLLVNLHVISTLNFSKQLLKKSHKSTANKKSLVQQKMVRNLVHQEQFVKLDGEQHILNKKIV